MTMLEAKAIYKATGSHFFDKDTIEFWGSKIESELYKNRCFITSENNFDSTARFYTVRRFSEDFKSIDTIGEFQAYKTKEEAQAAIKTITD